MIFIRKITGAVAVCITLMGAAPAEADITLYAGRGETLVAPLLEMFTAESGIAVKVRYGGTAELAILLREEGDASPADVYWAQDVTALTAVADHLKPLPAPLLATLSPLFRDDTGKWLGVSGRARLLIYAPERIEAAALPSTLMDMAQPQYRKKFGIAPTNGSFIAHVAAMRSTMGDAATAAWLKGIVANKPLKVANNTALHQAVADGEIDFALSNHYYLQGFLARNPAFPVAQAAFTSGDIGNLMMPTGVGIVQSTDAQAEAEKFVAFLLSPAAQRYFAESVFEYPVLPVEGFDGSANAGISQQQAVSNAPTLNPNSFGDLDSTLALIRDAGLL